MDGCESAVILFIKNWSFKTKAVYLNMCFVISLSIAILMHDTAYLATNY